MASSRRAVLAVLLVVCGGVAQAQFADFEACVKQSGENAIAACSAAISSGNFSGDRLAELYNSRGAEWRIRGNYERAIADYTEALLTAPHYIAALNNRCWALAASGRAKEGLDDCNVSLRVRPGNDLAHHNRALAHFQLGNYDEALADIGIALNANPRRAQMLFLRGLVKLRRGDTAGGESDIAAAKKIRAAVDEDFRKIGLGR